MSFVDSLSESDRKRRGLSFFFKDQDNQFDNNKLTYSDSVTVSRNPTSDNEPGNRNSIDDASGKRTFSRFNQTLE